LPKPVGLATLSRMTDTAPDWPLDIYHALRAAAVRQVSYVPDAGHSRLIGLCHDDPLMVATVLTSEQEGVGLACGAWLGGERAVLLMQSSGVGNCVNAFSLLKTCGFPFLTLVTMRGQWGEFNPWQVPMGQATAPTLELSGVIVQPVDRADQVGPTVAAAAKLAFDSSVPVAVLLGQRLIGTKSFTPAKE
jgi:sulfopyruvate decarboxylase alpha subunit